MKALIVDDEAPARTRLRRLLEEIDGIEVVGEAADGRSALEAQRRLRPDLLLLDIRMPVMDGLEVARQLARLPQPPAVIFTTAYSEHALEAFDTAALDYLVKPVRRERLAQALQRVQRLTPAALEASGEEGRRKHLTVRKHGGLHLIPFNEITHFQADNKYVTAYLPGREELLEESLKQLEEEYGERLLRIHRNALVNLEALEGLEKDGEGRCYVTLQGAARGPEISRRHLAEVRRVLKSKE